MATLNLDALATASPTRHKEPRSLSTMRSNGISFSSQDREGASLTIQMPDKLCSDELVNRTGQSSSNANVTGSSLPSAAVPAGRIGDLRLRGSGGMAMQEDRYTSGLIKPFNKPDLSVMSAFARELRIITLDPRSRKIFVLGVFNILCTVVLLMCCNMTESIALTAYTYLTIFDLFILLTCLLSIWIEEQSSSSKFMFGYERFEVLAVFASTIMAHLGSFFIVKESIERLMLLPEIHISRFPLGAIVAFICHMVVTYGTNNKSWNHVVSAASSSWLQEHVADVSQSVCHAMPGLSAVLLPRANPLVLIAFAGGIALFLTHLLIELNNYHMADPIAAISIAMMTCGTMFPMSVYSGKILLQTTPSHIVGQLDKCLREASTLDGVLEFRNEHFWTLSFGLMAGSLHVRVRRDANEQLVLAHLVDRLSNLVKVLTIQVFKDDWTRSTTTFQLLNDTARLTGQKLPNASGDGCGLPRLPTPTVNSSDIAMLRPITTSYSSYIKQSLTNASYTNSNPTKCAGTDGAQSSYSSTNFAMHPAPSSSSTFIPSPNTFSR